MKTKNLQLIGAWLVRSTEKEDYPKAIRKVMYKADKEISAKLSEKQFKLFEKGKYVNVVPQKDE